MGLLSDTEDTKVTNVLILSGIGQQISNIS